MFREIKQKKVALDIIRQVRQAILDGKLRPGDRLPPERELVLKFGLSKHSLREPFGALPEVSRALTRTAPRRAADKKSLEQLSR